MNLDPVPPVRPLLTHVIADDPLRHEAGIIVALNLGLTRHAERSDTLGGV